MTNSVTYSDDIQNMIIANLDGWRVEVPEPVTNETDETDETNTEETNETTNNIDPFMTSVEAQNKANKIITQAECQLFYEEALDLAYMHTNRLNIDDLTTVEANVFIRAVCKWAASNLWNKYNIRVNNEDMEDTYIQSYGGLLYKSALKTLQPFINQRITGLIKKDNDSESDIWLM